MKDPVSILGGWRGFHFAAGLCHPERPRQTRREGTNRSPGNLFPKEVQRCPHGWKFC
ncbi:hypothetical protein ABIE49_008051 [Bradyrhizobium sp. OAE829]